MTMKQDMITLLHCHEDSDGYPIWLCCIVLLFKGEHGLVVSPVRGTTGRVSQLQISIMDPSGSWKKSWSTTSPASSTLPLTNSIFISFSFFSTIVMLSHCIKNNFSKCNVVKNYGITITSTSNNLKF